MKMKSTQLFVPMMMVIMITIVPKTTTITTSWTTTTPRPTTTTPRPTTTTPKPTTTTPRPTTTTRKWTTTTRRWTTTTQWTTGHPAVNLNGKMVTLSYNGGGISFYPPNYSPQPSAWPSTPSYTTTYPFSTTPPSTRGLSMCLRYLSDYMPTSYPPTFIVSPRSSHPLTLRFRTTSYEVSFDRYGYTNLYLSPRIKLLPGVAPDIWTRVCLTIDSMKNVAQMFSGSYMSIRKMLNDRYSWTSEPVIAVSGFDGQVTDVQMWDYPLSYREVTDYMNGGVYRLYRGSVLSWSYINYSLSGNVLLEDVYEIQAKQPVSRRGRGRRPKGENKTRRVFNVGESKSRERQQL
ncbi:cell wall integrity and stress response component 4-like [Seriola dumerili]|uniref:Cell wall integrity and stress response component 4-like n=1 Tax=Seriola dumerili TaxID=41447 RepID=A0A3B4VG93_SERDU|nr:cell wall integrity and stress response component 4-like [Seriola dumerili]